MGTWKRIVGILLVLGIAGYGIYVQVLKWQRENLEISQERYEEAWKTENERLQKEISDLEAQLASKQEATLPEAKLAEVFGGEAEGMRPEEGEPSCETLDKEVREFFAYLDGKPYVQAYRLGKGSLEYFRGMLDRLSKRPPAVSAELKDPYLLIQNVAHFYRVLGKKDVLLARDVIRNESEIAEPVGALLYKWSSAGGGCGKAHVPQPSFGTLYEYAGFFLNSLGGKSYLLRRDPRVRILTTYYSVLILDRANREEMNHHGIDIRPHIESVAEEVRNSRSLVFQKEYLETLKDLEDKYRPR